MSIRAVHWHEGMFLRPQHFQAAQRFAEHQGQRGAKWAVHYNWGLRSILIDREALRNHRLVIRSLEARLRDGTLVTIPEDNALPELDLKPALERERSLTVFLAVPSLRVGRANVAGNGQTEGGRFLLESQELEDENTGLDPEPLEVRLLNVKLLLSNQTEHPGYEALPIARINKGTDADTTPRIDLDYIPPLLACDGWEPLQVEILRTIYNRIGVKIELLANQVVSQGIAVESHAADDSRIIGYLRALNAASAYLGILFYADGVHPLDAYLQLCGLVGQLSIFSSTHRPPELPRYDHDDLRRFYDVKKYLDALLDVITPPPWVQRPFIGRALRMQVALEPVWLEPACQMYVGVQTPLPADQCISLLTTAGQLDMKIGSSDRVDRIFEMGQAGLNITPILQPPRSLPTVANLVYFQVNRDAQPQEWQHVQKSLTLAIRLNERRIAGNIQEAQILTIKQGGQTTTLCFTLYVVRPA